MEATAPGFNLGHRPLLDVVRGLAILAVLGDHYAGAYMLGGFVGVDLFFVLSGFLITVLLLEEWRRDSTFDVRGFYWRRALRLFPALYVMLGVLAWLEWVKPGTDGNFWAAGVAVTLYVLNWWQLWSHDSPHRVGHLWSLSVEEQFYLVWPLLLGLALRRDVGPRILLRILASLALLVGICRYWAFVLGTMAYTRTDLHCDGLLMGCALAVAIHHGWLTEVRRGWPAVALTVFLAAVFTVHGSHAPIMYAGGFSVMGLAATVLVASAALQDPQPLGPVQRLLAWFGRLSYSIYLWHVPFGRLVDDYMTDWLGHESVFKACVKLTGSLLIAAVSYYAVERPMLKLKRRFEA